jgi:hypothetical protein
MIDYANFNLWAVLIAAVASFVIGGAWYSPALFNKAWMEGAGLKEEDLQKGHPAKVFGGALALQIVAAWALAMLIGDSGWAWGLHWGLFVGLCFAITANGVDCLFERASLKLFLVNAGYKLVSLTTMGTIIGLGQS